MATKQDLRVWLMGALEGAGGRASIVQICRDVWAHHEGELRSSGDLFFTWQYHIRWAATDLRRDGTMRPVELSPRGIWELANRQIS
ncbi:MAG: hypothetical protein MUP15_03420 [Dehalococcoidia bacterium]|nr:hypothetical protein [Dehalococcoidia bacterium]